MKIGIITNLYPPHTRGGAENIIVRTVEQLLELGHDVFVITGQPRSAGNGPVLAASSIERVYRFSPKNVYFTLDDHQYRWPVRLLWHVVDAFATDGATIVRDVLRDEQPDVVVTHNLKGIGLKIPAAVQALGIPHVHIMHDLQLVTPSGLRMFGQEREPWYTTLAYMVYRSVCRARLGRPTMVISPSQFLIDAYKEAGFFRTADVRHIPNPAPQPSGAKRDAQRAPGPLRIAMIGQLGHHKGLGFLLDAFATYEGNARLHIVGGGPLRSLVEERAKHDPRIVYLGYMPQEEVMRCITGVDVVVVPSLCYENSPTVIYEALSAGIPLIASRIGGVGELIQSGRTGFLFTPGNTEELLNAFRLMDAQKDAFAARADVMRESVAQYALPLYADRLVDMFKEAIAKPRQR